MPHIRVELPSLLHQCVGGEPFITVEADTVSQAINELAKTYPLLRDSIFESDGTQRRHVLIFYNEENTRWLEDLDIPITDKDRLTVVQSIAGG